jgi:hypothetical protein
VINRRGPPTCGECCTQYEDGTVSAYPLYEQMTGGCRRLRHSAAHARGGSPRIISQLHRHRSLC